MDSTQAVAQLEQAHSEAIMNAVMRVEPTMVQVSPLAAAMILEYIAGLQERNATLGRRYAAEAEAVARVSYYAGGLSQTVETMDNVDIAEAIMKAITENP